MITYEKYTNISNEEYIIKTDNNGVVSFIPVSLENADYQVYLASLEENNAN